MEFVLNLNRHLLLEMSVESLPIDIITILQNQSAKGIYAHGLCYKEHNRFLTLDDCKDVCVKRTINFNAIRSPYIRFITVILGS